MLSCFSHVWLFATPWTVAHQAPLSTEFSRQEYWSGLPCPSPGDLPDPGIEPKSPTLQAHSLPFEPPGKPYIFLVGISNAMLCSQCSLSVLYHFALSHSVMFTLTPWLSCSLPGFFTVKSLFVPLWRYFKTIIHSSSKILPLMNSHGCFRPALLLWWLPNHVLLFQTLIS